MSKNTGWLILSFQTYCYTVDTCSKGCIDNLVGDNLIVRC